MRYSYVLILAAACGTSTTVAPTHVIEHDGARNAAYRAAADKYGISEDWLVAVGFQQGRFEPAEREDTAPDPAMMPVDASATLAADTPVDEVDAVTDDSMEAPDTYVDPRSWGVMYLTDAQIERAANLTGHTQDELRGDIAANIDGAAALIADGGSDLRAATTRFLGVTDAAADLALHDLDAALAAGFDVTTEDGERLEVAALDPVARARDLTADDTSLLVDPMVDSENSPPVDPTIERTAPGRYPPVQWIPSPNHSSRLGYPIRYVVIHDIEGTMAGAISVFRNAANQTSAHYIVRSRDGHIVKMVYESQNAWHAGHGWFNRHSIGIEHEGFAHRVAGGGYYTDRLYHASAELTCAIAHRYHIPVDRKHIFGHMNVPSSLASHTLCSDARGIAGACGGVSHHSDPGRYWNWSKYMHYVASCVAAAG